jgi:hypothetical protein
VSLWQARDDHIVHFVVSYVAVVDFVNLHPDLDCSMAPPNLRVATWYVFCYCAELPCEAGWAQKAITREPATPAQET